MLNLSQRYPAHYLSRHRSNLENFLSSLRAPSLPEVLKRKTIQMIKTEFIVTTDNHQASPTDVLLKRFAINDC